MEPPPPPSSSQFLIPKGPARPRTTNADSSAAATAHAPATADPPSESSDAGVLGRTDSVSDTIASQEFPDGIIYYKKPDITASQVGLTQPTQLAEAADDDLDDDDSNIGPSTLVASLQGHGTTTSVGLTLHKDVHVFGTSKDCDHTITCRHWKKMPSNTQENPEMRTPGLWFKIYVERSTSTVNAIKLYVEDVSISGILVQGRKLAKGERKLLQYGHEIKADYGGRELFRFTVRIGKTPENSTTICGDSGMHYVLDEKSFAGGMYSAVYRARDVNDKHEYACKVIDRMRREFNEQEKAAIGCEIDVLKRLNHNNILRFVDVSQVNYKTYIFTEYIHGVTLHDYYHKNNNYLSELEAREIFKQVCEAIRYLHGMEIVHRDIKSENIMIADDTKCVKLIDFDIWALGVMLYRMLTGSYPFDSDLYRSDESSPDSQDTKDRLIGNELTNLQTRQETGKSDQMTNQMGVERMPPLVKNRVGNKAYYERDWHRWIGRKSARSDDGSEQSSASSKEPWGELVIVPGSIADAPRRIMLTEDYTWLGRGPKATVNLGQCRYLSALQCYIRREADGTVLMADPSANGTSVNKLKLGPERACQLLDGDELGFLRQPDDEAYLTESKVWYQRSLKYTFKIHGAVQPTLEDYIKRRYVSFDIKSVPDSLALQPTRRVRLRIRPSRGDAWATLMPLNDHTTRYELVEPEIRIGRDKQNWIGFKILLADFPDVDYAPYFKRMKRQNHSGFGGDSNRSEADAKASGTSSTGGGTEKTAASGGSVVNTGGLAGSSPAHTLRADNA
ncbi:hypothetical protein EDD11_000487 [Mortierella claussenii]|nr:hypothetical protein EDD11_000487 [Mortierella claussenii]